MKNTILILLIGLTGLLSSCEKDGEQIFMLDNPVAPEIVTMPDLTLKRANGTQILEFVGTSVDPGFQASANYFLEAAAAGTNFAEPIAIINDIQDNSMKISVSELNGILLKKFPANEVSSVDFRLRSVLVVDAGTTAPGTGSNPFQYTSAVKNAKVTLYGLPKLDLINSGIDQIIESPLGDGKYSGYVKLDVTKPFTLKDTDANIVYGANGAALAVNGNPIVPSDNGWFLLEANTTALTYKMDPYMIGLVGSSTPNGWNSPDQKMDYDSKTGKWSITTDLIVGFVKFRRNDSWSWELGPDSSGSLNNLIKGGVGNDIPINTAGNYTITLTINADGVTGSCTIVKN
ncbi:MAG TPA: SusE domain-containing protein [Draconibacterium sp.]|nr:SusE domain-containing protein [Draconibacterium sp.]